MSANLDDRDQVFKARMDATAILSKSFGFSISDINELAIEELEYYLELYGKLGKKV